ncbi:MAG TPA: gamma-glutamyltransferase [Microvirga sp.]|nr:gamma-glutamyltransferase [Microvirga sp.]
MQSASAGLLILPRRRSRPGDSLAKRELTATPDLAGCVASTAHDLARDPGLAALFLPSGQPLQPGSGVVQSDCAATLRLIAQVGAGALYRGPLGNALVSTLATQGECLASDDLAGYRLIDREPIRARYRGFEITDSQLLSVDELVVTPHIVAIAADNFGRTVTQMFDISPASRAASPLRPRTGSRPEIPKSAQSSSRSEVLPA